MQASASPPTHLVAKRLVLVHGPDPPVDWVRVEHRCELRLVAHLLRWVRERFKEWVKKWVKKWIKGWVKEWVKEWVM